MKRSETKKAKRQKTKNGEDIDAIINKILRKKITITEAVKKYDISYSFINKRIASIKNPELNKTYNQTEAVGKYDVSYITKNKKLANTKNPDISKVNKECASIKNPDVNKTHNQTCVFTKEQELTLRDHILKCCKTQYGVTNTTIRKMTYEYAIKLPDCNYPKSWDAQEMASMDWFFKFRSRYPGLKKALTKKFQHTCICIMGCHMGPEGKQALKKLEAKVLIARVYHYLQREYEYMKMCNDLGLLVNILRRTAEATGVCEQTITKILDEEKRATLELNDIIPCAPKGKKKKETIMNEHNYSNGIESPNTETVDEDSSSSNNIQYSDFERLQQNATFIKSVKVEILDDDFLEQDDQQNNEDEPMKIDLIVDEPSAQDDQQNNEDEPIRIDSIEGESSETDTHETETKVRIDSMDIKHNKLDDNLHTEGNKMRIIFTDDEPDKNDLYRDAEDTAISIDYTDIKSSKTNSSDTQGQVTITSDGDGDFEGELVIDESQLNLDYNAVDRIEGDVISIQLNQRSPEDTHTISSDKRHHLIEFCGDKIQTVKNGTNSTSVDDVMTI